jgi:hypothetical protein
VSIWANSSEVLMPLWHILIRDSCTNIKHEDCSVCSNIVSISEAT